VSVMEKRWDSASGHEGQNRSQRIVPIARQRHPTDLLM
jgi:hypothetical protein